MTLKSVTASETVGGSDTLSTTTEKEIAPKIKWRQGEPLFEVSWRGPSKGFAGSGVKTNFGLEVQTTDTALEIKVQAGDAIHNGSIHTLGSDETHTLSSGDSNNDRWDTVYFDTDTDSSNVREGTAQTNPEPPDVNRNEILLAIIYVPQNASDIGNANIQDWRVFGRRAEDTNFEDKNNKYSSDTVEAAITEVVVDDFAASESGTVQGMDAGNIYTTQVPDGADFKVQQAGLLLADGQAAPSNLDLVIATFDNSGNATKQTTVITGDGTVKGDETGSPLASYTNSSGSAQSVALLVDNGFFNAGTGSDKDVYATARGEIV